MSRQSTRSRCDRPIKISIAVLAYDVPSDSEPAIELRPLQLYARGFAIAETNDEMESRFESAPAPAASTSDRGGRYEPDFPGFFLARAWPWAWHRRRRLSQSQTSHVQGTQRRCSQTPLTGGVRAGSGSVEWQLRPAAGLTRSHARRFFGQSLVRSMLSSWPLLMRRSQMRDVAMNVCSRSSLCATVAAPCYVLYYPCDGGVL
jgi:hypothetical protein